ncbi:aromatic-L-amino-acid decarboxylase-like [Hetaerina americana]|uniref:aromatic-L-amino-acid decarboxylase-like n=1 Tax=Hetaerina americana TaxID=62018 RepID=UPI003A7F17E3
MNAEEFREFGKATVDYIADYLENIRDRQVLPSVEPGYIQNLLPDEAPEEPEQWQDVLKDVERIVMPGVTHWHSPQFHAYYPTANSYPGIVGELLSAGIGCIGFSWMTSPACTELEVAMMDWLGKLLDLPKEFLNCSDGPGGGVIQGSASEASLVALLAAKERTVKRIQKERPEWDEGTIKAKLVAYTSDQSNSSVEKAGVLGSMTMRLLPVDEKCSFRGSTLRDAVAKDIEQGLIPCCLIATLGTTGTCAFDSLVELAPVCSENNIWLHVDAAYAGAAFICPEFRHHMAGVEYADSFNFNPHKWLLVNFDCSALWVKNANDLVDAFSVDRIYLAHQKQGLAPDYRNWQIPLGRRFRSLKLWFVLRLYGASGLRKHIRKQVALAQTFEKMVVADPRFELVLNASMGLVCFRVKGPESVTKKLYEALLKSHKIYVTAATYAGSYMIRFAVCSRFTEEKDVLFAWKEICDQTECIIAREQNGHTGNSFSKITPWQTTQDPEIIPANATR